MADYFTRFSVVLSLPDKAAQEYALDLASKAERMQQGDDPPDNFPESLTDMIELWHFETEADNRNGAWALWLHSENGGIDAVCSFIQHLLQKFNPAGRLSFEWSNDCSQPRTDAYGGGAAIITAREIKSMSTTEWLQRNSA